MPELPIAAGEPASRPPRLPALWLRLRAPAEAALPQDRASQAEPETLTAGRRLTGMDDNGDNGGDDAFKATALAVVLLVVVVIASLTLLHAPHP